MPKIVDEHMREATRRRVIAEAASEFARLGFDQANINTIAEQAGIGKGTIYLYFENKRDLFIAMLRSITAIIRPRGPSGRRFLSPADGEFVSSLCTPGRRG